MGEDSRGRTLGDTRGISAEGNEQTIEGYQLSRGKVLVVVLSELVDG